MKSIRLLIAAGLALAVLVGVVLALTWWQPATVRAEDPAIALQRSGKARPLLEWWNGWYFKDPYPDYAPSGVPDFDQKQDDWFHPPSGQWSYCGPVAVANSLWWFDSKFEPYPVGPPGPPPSDIPYNDNYYLVTTYQPGLDDHDPLNVGGMGPPGLVDGLVDDLACYFDTDGRRSGAAIIGTEVHAMAYGLQQYLYNDPTHPCYIPYRSNGGSYYDDYHVQLVKMPTFEWVEEEVERSEDVILLLGFWQEQPEGSRYWVRLGGHYVTVAGINSADLQIAFSDPFFDNAESGGPGRVLSGTIYLPHSPGHPSSLHNDAGNVSHDVYTATLDPVSPGGLWEIEGYPYEPSFEMQNCPEEFKGDQGGPMGGPILVEVEYALATSPFYWKPGGEWVWQWWSEEWFWEWWWYEDDGDSCLPDFWWGLGVDWEAYDGPVAVGNSFWWFDSKAETLKADGFPKDPQKVITDHYSLIEAYGDWDDHAISNTVPFIDDLAVHLGTGAQGTTPASMTAGIGAYLAARDVADDFYIKMRESPSFEWVADEVETCEDVILLLGFWEHIGGEGEWGRKGGHWVNAAGVNRENRLIGLSDPALNNAMNPSIGSTLYPGRVFPPERLEVPFVGDEQSAPQNISHDIYEVITSTSPGGEWALVDYPATSVITDFIGLNGGGSDWAGHPISTEVEWAIAVSPYSDLVLTKTAVVTEVVPGDRVTYTLEYANTGLAAVDHVTITDLLPLEHLTDIAYASWPPLGATSGITYVWTLPRLSYGQRGVITITAQSLVTTTLYNTAHITGLNSIGGPTPDRDPTNNTVTICDPVGNVGFQYTPPDPWVGQTIAFTGTATGSSPITYTWGADDGWSATGSTSSHAFTTRGNHMVWLTATNPCGQDYTSTVIFVREYGVVLQPGSGDKTENPDKVVTYTLMLYNTGNVDDNYTIAGSVAGQSWTTNWPMTPVGPVVAGGKDQFDVTVQIPSGASDGDWSRATITATSQGDHSKWDTSVLTTTAYIGTITRDVLVTPISTTASGDPGETVCFTLTITNAGTGADRVNITHTFPVSWIMTFTPTPPYGLGSGENQAVQACITIPAGAEGGSTKAGVVTVVSQDDPSVSKDVDVNVLVGWKFIYLPLVLRNYSSP
jgi:uncharacterized repeat protein (TIGR01451 family)